MHPNHKYILSRTLAAQRTGGSDFRILDYGCGAGEVVFAARESGVCAFGADIFYEGKSRRDQIPEGAIGNSIHDISSTGRLDFPDRFFDFVVCNQVFEHVENLGSVVAEIHRVLKPNGTFITLFPTADVIREGHVGIPFIHWFASGSSARYYWAYLLRLIGFGYHKAGKPSGQWVNDSLGWLDKYTHYRTFSMVRQLLNRSGFDVQGVESEYIGFRLSQCRRLKAATPLLRLPLMKHAIRTFCTRFGGRVLECRKPTASGHVSARAA